jgi:hypothetical protein
VVVTQVVKINVLVTAFDGCGKLKVVRPVKVGHIKSFHPKQKSIANLEQRQVITFHCRFTRV